MSIVQDKEIRMKMKLIFNKYANAQSHIPHQKIKKFFQQLGVTSELFFHDFYYYFPAIEKGGDLSYNDCIAFLDYILTAKYSNKDMMNVFKMFDKNGTGHIATAELLQILRKQLPNWEYERYAQIISTYGPAINYIDIFHKKRHPNS